VHHYSRERPAGQAGSSRPTQSCEHDLLPRPATRPCPPIWPGSFHAEMAGAGEGRKEDGGQAGGAARWPDAQLRPGPRPRAGVMRPLRSPALAGSAPRRLHGRRRTWRPGRRCMAGPPAWAPTAIRWSPRPICRVMAFGCCAAIGRGPHGVRRQPGRTAGQPCCPAVPPVHPLRHHEARINNSYFQGVHPLSDGQGNPPGWENPYQQGWMTLLSPARAVFRDKAGHQVQFRLRPGATAFRRLCS
jgi:hypothetical protein